MNIQLLTEVRDWLAAGAPETEDGFVFDMEMWIEAESRANGWCGTSCCIAGAALVFGDHTLVQDTLAFEAADLAPGQPFIWECDVQDLAAELLDLDYRTSSQLFVPWDWDMPGDYNPTPSHAAEVITHLIETGEVKW